MMIAKERLGFFWDCPILHPPALNRAVSFLFPCASASGLFLNRICRAALMFAAKAQGNHRAAI
jgi:hypothetical protein